MFDDHAAKSVDSVIRARRTTKIFADKPLAGEIPDSVIQTILDSAGWGPVHRPAEEEHRTPPNMTSIFPWRFHVLTQDACLYVRDWLLSRHDATKIPSLLATASLLVQVTWLPNKQEHEIHPSCHFEGSESNMEHIAAASAAIQNVLLSATARNIPNYWSSGGALRDREIMDLIGVPEREILLGSVFLFSPKANGDKTVSAGKLRSMRGKNEEWLRWVSCF